MEELEARYGADIVRIHSRAWQLLSASLTTEIDQDILCREFSPSAAWRSLLQMYSPKTQGARLALLSKLDNVTVNAEKDPISQLVDLESTARMLRNYPDFRHLNEALVLSKFVSALPDEYDIQRQMLESMEGDLSQKTVVSTARAKYESAAFQKNRGNRGAALATHGQRTKKKG